jgi:phosphoenolpyruvate-protein kinase (PTS system EI component)
VDDEVTLHPAVVLALKQIAETANRVAREACVCGERAGGPAIACLLVGLGFRGLSVSPIRATKVKAAIQRARLGELTAMAERVLACRNSTEVREEVRSRLQAGAVSQEVSHMHRNMATDIR